MSVSKWRYTEECNGRPCPGDCDHCSFEPGDLISRADAIEAVRWETSKLGRGLLGKGDILDIIEALPSAEANPTIVRCKTMIPYGDFREWAKRIREDNPNVIVIPFDAEVASAEAVQGEWIEKGGELVCSVCGNSVSFSRTPKGWVLGRFCQTCGARMKGGDTE